MKIYHIQHNLALTWCMAVCSAKSCVDGTIVPQPSLNHPIPKVLFAKVGIKIDPSLDPAGSAFNLWSFVR